jgi:hypothetical protein
LAELLQRPERRLAIWGFYDGIYDIGPERFAQNLLKTKNPGVKPPSTSRATRSRRRSTAPAGAAMVASSTAGARASTRLPRTSPKGPFFLRVGRQAISWGEADTIGLLDANNPSTC